MLQLSLSFYVFFHNYRRLTIIIIITVYHVLDNTDINHTYLPEYEIRTAPFSHKNGQNRCSRQITTDWAKIYICIQMYDKDNHLSHKLYIRSAKNRQRKLQIILFKNIILLLYLPLHSSLLLLCFLLLRFVHYSSWTFVLITVSVTFDFLLLYFFSFTF